MHRIDSNAWILPEGHLPATGDSHIWGKVSTYIDLWNGIEISLSFSHH